MKAGGSPARIVRYRFQITAVDQSRLQVVDGLIHQHRERVFVLVETVQGLLERRACSARIWSRTARSPKSST